MAKKANTASTRARPKKRAPRKTPPTTELPLTPPPAIEPAPDQPFVPGGPLLIEHDGVSVEQLSVVVNGEQWIPLHVHQQAIEELKLQQPPSVEDSSTDDKPGPRKHLRCPVCFDNLGGVAARRKWQHQVSTRQVKRCYVCNQCGAEWVVKVNNDESDDGVLYQTTQVAEVREHKEQE